MRLFAGDWIPKLVISPDELPRPWVVPWALPRRHKDRLVALLGQALCRFDERVSFVELDWVERRSLGTRMKLRRPTLVWWRIDALVPRDPREVMAEGSRITPGWPVYDFAAQIEAPALGWMPALKVRVLHAVIDAISEREPVAQVDEVLDVLQEIAVPIISPVDLIEVAEQMVTRIGMGESVAIARAEALARMVAQRFAPERDDREPADPYVETMAALAVGKPLTDRARQILVSTGFMEPAMERPLPLADVLQEPEVAHRVVRELVSMRRLQTPLAELAPGLPLDASITQSLGMLDGGILRQPALMMATSSVETQDMQAEEEARNATQEPAIAQAAVLFMNGDSEDAARRLVGALRERRDLTWSRVDIRVAGYLLLDIAAARKRLLPSSSERLQIAAEGILVLLGEAARLLESVSKWDGAARAYLLQADLYRLLSELPRWREALRHAEHLAQLGVHLRTQAYLLAAQAELALGHDKPSKAEELCQQALNLYRKMGDRLGEANVLQSLGNLMLRRNELGKAEELCQQALNLYRKMGDRLGEANVLQSLGNLMLRRNELGKAEELYQQALVLYHEIGMRLGEANALRSLGNLMLRRNELGKAEELYQQVLVLYRELGERLGEANALRSLGELMLRREELGKAEELYQQALVLYREIDERVGEANALTSLGDLAQRQHEEGKAEELYGRALDLYREIDEQLGEATILRAIAKQRWLCDGDPDDYLAKSEQLSASIFDEHGVWLSRVLGAVAHIDASAPDVLDQALHFFDSKGFTLEAALTRATLAAVAGHIADAAALLQPRLPDCAAAVASATTPADALRLIVEALPL